MWFQRRVLGIVCACLAALSLSGAALGATPRTIYADYANNGRLDQQYSQADLRAALQNASLQGYGNPNVNAGFEGAVQGQLGTRAGALPFTGFEIALVAAGAMFALLAGVTLRRLGRQRV